MLASQLCLLDDKSGLESKLVKGSEYGCVVQLVHFVKISICDALSQFYGDACPQS